MIFFSQNHLKLRKILSGVPSCFPLGVLWYFHTYVGSGHFWGVQNIKFQYFGGFQKKEYSLGYEDFVDFFFWGGGGGGGSSQNWTIFRGHFCAFYGLFLRSMYRMGDIFCGAYNNRNGPERTGMGLLKFLIFLGCLKFLNFWG